MFLKQTQNSLKKKRITEITIIIDVHAHVHGRYYVRTCSYGQNAPIPHKRNTELSKEQTDATGA